MVSAAFLVYLAQVYLVLGGFVAIVFLLVGIDRVDAAAAGARAFRTLLIPGICLIWPMVLWRWHRLEKTAGEND